MTAVDRFYTELKQCQTDFKKLQRLFESDSSKDRDARIQGLALKLFGELLCIGAAMSVIMALPHIGAASGFLRLISGVAFTILGHDLTMVGRNWDKQGKGMHTTSGKNLRQHFRKEKELKKAQREGGTERLKAVEKVVWCDDTVILKKIAKEYYLKNS